MLTFSIRFQSNWPTYFLLKISNPHRTNTDTWSTYLQIQTSKLKIKKQSICLIIHPRAFIESGRTDHTLAKLLLEHERHRNPATPEDACLVGDFHEKLKKQRRGNIEWKIPDEEYIRQLVWIPFRLIFGPVDVIAHRKCQGIRMKQLHVDSSRLYRIGQHLQAGHETQIFFDHTYFFCACFDAATCQATRTWANFHYIGFVKVGNYQIRNCCRFLLC